MKSSAPPRKPSAKTSTNRHYLGQSSFARRHRPPDATLAVCNHRSRNRNHGLLRLDEAMMASLLATTNPGDEVIIFEPYYENYGPDTILSGAKPRFVKLRRPPHVLITQKTSSGPSTKPNSRRLPRPHQSIIVNTPNNPTGKVFSRAELELIRDLCLQHNVLAITDEIYETSSSTTPNISQ